MAAFFQALIAVIRRRRRTEKNSFGKGRPDCLPRKADWTMHQYKIFRAVSPQIYLFQFVSAVGFHAGGKPASHLNAVGAQTQHFGNVFTVKNAACADDGNVDSFPHFRHDEPARAVGSQMPACFCPLYDDGSSTRTATTQRNVTVTNRLEATFIKYRK